MKKADLIFNILLLPLDFLAIVFGALAAYFLRISAWMVDWRPVLFLENLPLTKYLTLTIFVSLSWLVILAISGLYRVNFQKVRAREFFNIFIATSAGLLLIVVYIFLKREWFDSRFLILAGWFFATIFIILGRIIFRKIFSYFIKKLNLGFQKVLVIGNSLVGESLIKEIKKDPTSYSYSSIIHLPNLDLEKAQEFIQDPDSQLGEVILADSNLPRDEILKLVDACEQNRIDFKFVPDLFQTFFSNIEISTFGEHPLIEIKRTPLDGWGKVFKRMSDILGSLIGILITLPFWGFIALAIKIDSPGPVLIKLKRIGQGKEFQLFKFRSMIKNAQALKPALIKLNERADGPLFKLKNDPRITRVGRFLRKYRIDEIPQFLNVLKGEMSLVGPRPHEPEEVVQYQKHHKRTFFVKPGMTGLAQISGSSNLKFEDEIKLDTYYIKNWSLAFDFKIMLKTLFKIFSDKAAA